MPTSTLFPCMFSQHNLDGKPLQSGFSELFFWLQKPLIILRNSIDPCDVMFVPQHINFLDLLQKSLKAFGFHVRIHQINENAWHKWIFKPAIRIYYTSWAQNGSLEIHLITPMEHMDVVLRVKWNSGLWNSHSDHLGVFKSRPT